MHDELNGLRFHLARAYSAFSNEVENYRQLFNSPGTTQLNLEEGFLRIASMLKGEENRGINYDADCVAEAYGFYAAELESPYFEEDDYNFESVQEADDMISSFKINVVQKARAAGFYIEDPTYDNNVFTLYDDFYDGGGPGPHISFNNEGKIVRFSKLDGLYSIGSLQDEVDRLSPKVSLGIDEAMIEGAVAELAERQGLQNQRYIEEEERQMLNTEGFDSIEPDEEDFEAIEGLVPPELEVARGSIFEELAEDHRRELLSEIRSFDFVETEEPSFNTEFLGA